MTETRLYDRRVYQNKAHVSRPVRTSSRGPVRWREITSVAGGFLLREVEQPTRILGPLSGCFTDHRDPNLIGHSLEELVKQWVLGLCLGYEDLDDHDDLWRERLLALLCNRDDLTGEFRRLESDRGMPGAGKSTLHRLERTSAKGPQGAYRRIMEYPAAMDALLMTWCEAEGIDYVLGLATNSS